MVNPFAAIEDSLNRASSAALANAVLTCSSGTVAVVFDRAESGMPDALGARAMREWQAGAPESDFVAHSPTRGMVVSIGGADYVVTESDINAGWQVLTLRKA